MISTAELEEAFEDHAQRRELEELARRATSAISTIRPTRIWIARVPRIRSSSQ